MLVILETLIGIRFDGGFSGTGGNGGEGYILTVDLVKCVSPLEYGISRVQPLRKEIVCNF